MPQQELQRFVARSRLQQHETLTPKQCFEGKQVFLEIVDQKEKHRVHGGDETFCR
jgi:hypothetical protein